MSPLNNTLEQEKDISISTSATFEISNMNSIECGQLNLNQSHEKYYLEITILKNRNSATIYANKPLRLCAEDK